MNHRNRPVPQEQQSLQLRPGPCQHFSLVRIGRVEERPDRGPMAVQVRAVAHPLSRSLIHSIAFQMSPFWLLWLSKRSSSSFSCPAAHSCNLLTLAFMALRTRKIPTMPANARAESRDEMAVLRLMSMVTVRVSAH